VHPSYSIPLHSGAKFLTKTYLPVHQSSAYVTMSSSQDTASAQEHLIHPFEMFRALMDEYEYTLFESFAPPFKLLDLTHSFLITLPYLTFLLFLNLDVNPSSICSISCRY
jgi:hypothetical protein